MIRFHQLTFTYPGAARPALADVTLDIEEGEFVLVAGRTGSGKSTFLRAINGLVPHFTGGHLEGDVTVVGRSTRQFVPRDMADVVGFVGQDPLAGFVTDTVEDELAYGMEQLGVDAQTMRRRVEETLDLLGIEQLRRRALRSLSGGQQQRVAIGAVLAMHPAVLVLDEPTSALDPTAAEEVLATLARLVDDVGTTVIVAEHRMERVIPFADRMLVVSSDGSVSDGQPETMLATMNFVPPVIELGRWAGWSPLPLTVRQARRAGRDLRNDLQERQPPEAVVSRGSSELILTARDVVVRHGSVVAVGGATVTLHRGAVLALMGRNGSGKSSLLWALQGSGDRDGGTVKVAGKDPAELSAVRARQLVGLVPQSASDLLYLETVAEECQAADRETGSRSGSCWALVQSLAPGIAPQRHPRDLSEGQKLALVLAIQLLAAPPVVLLDEPTRGLDYVAKEELTAIISRLASNGHAVMVATHDVEFVALAADEAMVMAGGDIVAHGPVAEVLAGSPAFAPQVSKILGSQWLTVDAVREALPEGSR